MLQKKEKKNVFNIEIWRKVFVSMLSLTFIGVVWTLWTKNPITILVLIPLILSLCIYVQLAIGNYIKTKDIELKTGASFSNVVSIFLFWFVANLGVAYMQGGINRVIEHERKRS